MAPHEHSTCSTLIFSLWLLRSRDNMVVCPRSRRVPRSVERPTVLRRHFRSEWWLCMSLTTDALWSLCMPLTTDALAVVTVHTILLMFCKCINVYCLHPGQESRSLIWQRMRGIHAYLRKAPNAIAVLPQVASDSARQSELRFTARPVLPAALEFRLETQLCQGEFCSFLVCY